MKSIFTVFIGVMLLFFSTAGEAAVVIHEPQTHPGNRHNAMRAAELLNNHIIGPGRLFSFNTAVGPRTTEKGFIPGHAIVEQQHVFAVGGGVCRTSTAVFQAALEAGLPILERHPHNLQVAYTPPGTDATIWWPTADLKFCNNTGHSLIIRTRADLEKVEVVISPAVEIHRQGRPVGSGWLEEGRTMVYLRALGEALGAVVEWKDGRAYINGFAVPEDIGCADCGVLTVPLRDLVEMMGFDVGWEAGRVAIDTHPAPAPRPEDSRHPGMEI